MCVWMSMSGPIVGSGEGCEVDFVLESESEGVSMQFQNIRSLLASLWLYDTEN